MGVSVNMTKYVKLSIVLLFSLLVIVGCNANDNSDKAKGDHIADRDSNESKDDYEGKEFSIGDSVDFKGLSITLNSVRIDAGGKHDSLSQDKFIVANITIENKSEREKSVSSLASIKVKDEDGYEYRQKFTLDGIKGRIGGSISPGDKLRGEVPFDVANSDVYKISYSDPSGTGKIVWTIPDDSLENLVD